MKAASTPRCEACCSDSNNFTFAFDDSNFSDRTLRIEIIPDLAGHTKTDREGFNGIPDSARKCKRKKEDILIGYMITRRKKQILDCNMPDSEENRDEDAVAMIDETPASVGLNTNQLGGATEGSVPLSEPSTGLRVRTIHISSPILAAKSPFFFKLFSNGMRESEQQHVTLRIHASEEAALMDLLNFMYSNTLPETSPPAALLELLMAADKFEVASCMRYCSRLLTNIPMTYQSALLYLDLPSSVLMADTVQPLIEAAKQFLASRYKDFTNFYEQEVLNLPLAGIEAVLASDELQIASEDAVYDFLLKWARIHYPNLDERKEILGNHLVRFIRFPLMTCTKLKELLGCADLDSKLATKAVLDALFFKCNLPADDLGTAHHPFMQRKYKYPLVKVVELKLPRHRCVVYLDLKHEECANLFPVGNVTSQAFHLGGQPFFLNARCNMDQQNSFHYFGLGLGMYMQENRSVTFAVDIEFAARTKPPDMYVIKYRGYHTFEGCKVAGQWNLFDVPWTAFMAEDSHYFINGVLQLRAELTIRQ